MKKIIIVVFYILALILMVLSFFNIIKLPKYTSLIFIIIAAISTVDLFFYQKRKFNLFKI